MISWTSSNVTFSIWFFGIKDFCIDMDFVGMGGANLQIDYKADGNTIEAYQLLDTQTNLFNSQLLLKILYQLLELVPIHLKVWFLFIFACSLIHSCQHDVICLMFLQICKGCPFGSSDIWCAQIVHQGVSLVDGKWGLLIKKSRTWMSSLFWAVGNWP